MHNELLRKTAALLRTAAATVAVFLAVPAAAAPLAFIPEAGSSNVYAVDMANDIALVFATPGPVNAVNVHPKAPRVYFGIGTGVEVYDTNTSAFVANAPTASVQAMAVDTSNNRLLVLTSTSLEAFDADLMITTGFTRSTATGTGVDVDYASSINRIAMLESQSGAVTILDANNFGLVTTLVTGATPGNTHSLAFSSDGQRLFVLDISLGSAHVYDTATWTKIGTAAVGNALSSTSRIVPANTARQMYVGTQSGFSRLDANLTSTTIFVATQTGTTIGVDPSGTKIYVPMVNDPVRVYGAPALNFTGILTFDARSFRGRIVTSNPPAVSQVNYAAATGTMTFNGSNFVVGATVAGTAITARGEGGATYTLTGGSATVSSATSFVFTVSATDRPLLNRILNRNGTTAASGTVYNVALAEDWMNNVAPAVDIADAINPTTVGSILLPTVTSATYNNTTGSLVVTGTNLLSLQGVANDVMPSNFTITGQGGATRTLVATPSVDLDPANPTFTLTLGAADRAAVTALLNRAGSQAADGTSYNLSVASGWMPGADPLANSSDPLASIAVADTFGPVVTSVSVPAAGEYATGASLDFTVNFDEAVAVTGTPRIALSIGAAVRNAQYLGGTGTAALTFRYVVAAGDVDGDGITVGALTTNGGTMRDASSNDANLTLNGVGATFSVLVNTFTVTPGAGANGSIAPAAPQLVSGGNSAVFTVTPNTGYTASVGGSCGGTLVGTTYTTNAITGACTVSASFTLNIYAVTPSAGANGSISPAGMQTVSHGGSAVFTVTPNTGYTASVGGTCGGTLVGTNYTTNAITGPCTVVASFTQVTYGVTPSASANGSISPNTPQTIGHGNTTTFTVTPNTGYSASVGGTCGGTLVGTTYTTNPITAACTVAATFAQNTYAVTPSAGANGSITPNAPQTIAHGGTATFTVTPNTGYTASVGGTCGGTLAGNTYTTNVITAACTVAATFTQNTYAVTPSAGANGSITPATPQSIAHGATATFTITPATGYAAAVGGTCGGTLVGNTYTTNAITAACTVAATFTQNTYTVTPVASANGTIAPATPQTIAHGATATFTVTPNVGYAAAAGGTCGGTLVGNTLTTAPITAACTVAPTFTAAPNRTYTGASATGTGTITASFTGGGASCTYTRSAFIPVSGDPASPPAGSAPAGVTFPQGLFDFRLGGCTPGSTITMTITYPLLAPGTVYWKYGPTPDNATPHWYVLPAAVSGNSVTFTITDGLLGDDDLAANGAIIDQGGPGVPAGTVATIPTLSEWMLLLMAAGLMLVGMRRIRVGTRP